MNLGLLLGSSLDFWGVAGAGVVADRRFRYVD